MNRRSNSVKTYLQYLTIGAFASSLQILSAAEISGKVKLDGTPPSEKTIEFDAAFCGKLQPKPVTTRHYVVGADKGLANVFVYVKEGAKKTPPAAEPPMLDQVGCMYDPYVFGVVTDQKFKIRNSDAMLHNIHATPKINKEFNLGQPTKGMVSEKSFDKPEVLVRVKCDVHSWMFTYIGVCEHPYFAVTDKDGSFKIPNLPAGKYTIEAFHLKAGAKTQEITVADGDKKAVDFTLNVPAAP